MTSSISYAEVTSIDTLGIGTRVCVDMIDMLDPMEGVFVGNTGHGYIHVLSENRETETYPTRPFRMNVGAIHQYISIGEDQTKYVSELSPGMALPVSKHDQVRNVAIGRVKIEVRNFLRIVCHANGVEISATLQESDSVHVSKKDGSAVSVLDLKVGDQISCVLDHPGRHLGEKIEEKIQEL
ncbi:3-dehydroquinate synthase II [Aquibacillus albus]|uniref:3-dehydroquinate synthase class II n=1 Tax=Aquibacillus albus TaxID=1168171 RepID=A0ABS2MXV3_9BACI|nr:3-dehydroquinate synthase II [Aquibacillus albus]MBM7570623.1 3-dehydroquinate synthase class II [Aquibacillus albus]